MLVSLQGRTVRVGIDNSLRLTVSARDGEPLWESSRSLPPAVRVAVSGGGSHTIGLADARERSVRPYACGRHAGYRILLTGYADADVTLALTVALDADDDELLIGIEQAGGEHAVQRVDHLYRFERPVAQGGHLVLPHGSGYLVPADCPDALPGRGPEPIQVGGRWSLPMFGLTRDDAGLCATVDTWWDAEVRAHHLPGDRSILDFSWADELGTLAYPRRLLVHFARDLDYVAMAKRYRAVARQQGCCGPWRRRRTIRPGSARTRTTSCSAGPNGTARTRSGCSATSAGCGSWASAPTCSIPNGAGRRADRRSRTIRPFWSTIRETAAGRRWSTSRTGRASWAASRRGSSARASRAPA